MTLPKISDVINSLDIKTISKKRKLVLAPLVTYIQGKLDSNKDIKLNFICTHNSRRSHLSQVWAQAMASYFEIEKVYCFSGGTEATALYPMVVKTLERSGFNIKIIYDGNNPVYNIAYSENTPPVIGFSKTFDSEENPQSEFAAILTCSDADENCPFIKGAEMRFPITYEDPKASDGTAEQETVYEERSLQIATEMKYIFSEIKHK